MPEYIYAELEFISNIKSTLFYFIVAATLFYVSGFPVYFLTIYYCKMVIIFNGPYVIVEHVGSQVIFLGSGCVFKKPTSSVIFTMDHYNIFIIVDILVSLQLIIKEMTNIFWS